MKKMSFKLVLRTDQTQFHYLGRQLKVFDKSLIFSFIIFFWDLQNCYVISLILIYLVFRFCLCIKGSFLSLSSAVKPNMVAKRTTIWLKSFLLC
uniref:Putative ovule protein n=1 Tax=Solanum chacoense TaxID=4108 RepID=A0A0V0GZW7_SOLCH